MPERRLEPDTTSTVTATQERSIMWPFVFLAGFALGVIVTLLAGVAADRLPDEQRATEQH
jgi:hypothetical protein